MFLIGYSTTTIKTSTKISLENNSHVNNYFLQHKTMNKHQIKGPLKSSKLSKVASFDDLIKLIPPYVSSKKIKYLNGYESSNTRFALINSGG